MLVLSASSKNAVYGWQPLERPACSMVRRRDTRVPGISAGAPPAGSPPFAVLPPARRPGRLARRLPHRRSESSAILLKPLGAVAAAVANEAIAAHDRPRRLPADGTG